MNDRMEFEFTYNPGLHDEKKIQQFADGFLNALKEVIAHCQLPDAGGRTPSDFPLARLDQASLDRLLAEQPGIEDIYPLSPMQTLFFSANQGSAQAAFDQWHCTLRGDLNVDAFERAWNETIRRHTILRSTVLSAGLREPLAGRSSRCTPTLDGGGLAGHAGRTTARAVERAAEAGSRRSAGFDASAGDAIQAGTT